MFIKTIEMMSSINYYICKNNLCHSLATILSAKK